MRHEACMLFHSIIISVLHSHSNLLMLRKVTAGLCIRFIAFQLAQHADQTALQHLAARQTENAPALLMQNLLPTAAVEALEQVPAVMDLLCSVLVRDQAHRPSAGDIYDRCNFAHQLSCHHK